MTPHQPISVSVRPPMRRSRLLGSPRLPVGLLLHWATIAILVLAALLVPVPARAYIPAQATNETGVAQAAGQNFSDVSKLSLQWYPMGSYSERISYQLVGADSTGISKGALVHFSEDKLTNGTTTTPWIALVSCDANATDASMEDDIFTLARDRGAVAALLYSTKSVSCYINPEYSDPANFDQVMDIFATQSLSSSNLIESQFNAISTKYYWYSPSLLNDSASVIQTAIVNHTVPETSYLFATLTASNATDTSGSSGSGSTTTGTDSSGESNQGSGNTNTSLAMIILYAITGCVSALFCIVIISGAIRAIRHPERYGPRAANAFGGGPGTFGAQSRARGLTRAILDTFPVVKFGRNEDTAGALPPAKDIENLDPGHMPPSPSSMIKVPEIDGGADVAVELREWKAAAARIEEQREDGRGKEAETLAAAAAMPALVHTPGAHDEQEDPTNTASSSSSVSQARPRPLRTSPEGSSGPERDVVPDAIGRETCPICIVDFEEGDDLRVLPCEGHHRFHQECVDQWLLELSSSCPLCRQDFQALQTMMSAGDEGDALEPPAHAPGASRPISSAAARFSRYLRTARRRRQRQRRGSMLGREIYEEPSEYDATNPPMPLAPHTLLHM